MKITNTKAKIQISLAPTALQIEDKMFADLEFITNFVFNQAPSKQESKYFKNGGATTQTITGISYSATVTIDVDSTNEVHQYLMNIVRNRDINSMNNQWVKLIEPLFDGEVEAGFSIGKSVIEFKNNFPSGNVDELIKLEFDIFPQDDLWIYTPAKTTLLETPENLGEEVEGEAKDEEIKKPETLESKDEVEENKNTKDIKETKKIFGKK